jgi:hypothetical protein
VCAVGAPSRACLRLCTSGAPPTSPHRSLPCGADIGPLLWVLLCVSPGASLGALWALIRGALEVAERRPCTRMLCWSPDGKVRDAPCAGFCGFLAAFCNSLLVFFPSIRWVCHAGWSWRLRGDDEAQNAYSAPRPSHHAGGVTLVCLLAVACLLCWPPGLAWGFSPFLFWFHLAGLRSRGGASVGYL